MNKIRTGDILYIDTDCLGSIVIKSFTGSITNHTGIAVWTRNEQVSGKGIIPSDIVPRYTPGYKLMVADVTEFFYLTHLDRMAKRVPRMYYRKLKTKYSEEEICKKLLEFLIETKTLYIKGFFNGLKTLNFVFKWNQNNQDLRETCISWTVSWLEKLGYSSDYPGVPKLPKRLLTPDHLLPKFNPHPILGKRLIPIKETKIPYNQVEITLMSWFIILMIGLIFLGVLVLMQK